MYFQSFAEAHWDEHGKPAINLMVEKVLLFYLL